MTDIKPLKTKDDALRVVEFFFSDKVFEHEWAPGEKEMLEKAVHGSLTDGENHQYWFIEEGDKIIGAAGINENIYKSGGFEMSEDYFAVGSDCRGKGVGSLLLQRIEDFVKGKNGRYIVIETCDTPFYEPACRFYEDHGYKKVGTIPDYYNIGEGKIEYYKGL